MYYGVHRIEVITV